MPNKKFWQFCNHAGKNAELLLYGDISQTSWWGDEVTPREFANELRELGPLDNITVRINSGGGDVFAAQTIGNLLEQHPAQVTAMIDGLCASAATIVASHCARVVAANDSTYMVHPAKMGLCGYYEAGDLASYIEALNTIKKNIIGLYAKKTGHTEEQVTAWMDATSWWTGQEAMDNGFVDEMVEANAPTVENRNGVLFVNSISMGLPFEQAPKNVQEHLAQAGCTNNSHEEVNEMAEITSAVELRNAYPDLVAQIENAAAEQERQRIQNIEEMALPGQEAMTNEAKFLKPMSAAAYAQAAMKQVKAQGREYLNQAKADADGSGMGNVHAEVGGGKTGDNDEFLNAIKAQGAKK